MKSIFCLAILVATLTVLPSSADAADAPAKPKPNVLFIAVDDLNHWVHHLGRNPQSQTPNIDRLAARGVTFSHAYCTAPACNPSRASLMSGLRPSTSGCYLNGNPWKNHIREGLSLAATFKNAGYHTSGAGKIFHSDTFYPGEWTEYLDPKSYSAHGAGVEKDEGFHAPLAHDLKDEDIGDWHIVNWCIERLQRQHDQPFFLACGLHKPHLPFAVPRKYYERFPLDQIQLPPVTENDLADVPPAGVRMANPQGDHARFLNSGRWKAAIQSYLATCAYTDMNIGRLLDALDRSPHRDHTIIVLWGDHGWHFGEKEHWRKFALWEEATRAPLMWVAPGTTKPGSVCERPVDFLTIYPTLCDLAGIPVPGHVEGKSLRPLLINPTAEWTEPAICTHGFQNHTVRSAQWRYIRYRNGDEELYDHRQDRYEWKNLANDPKHQLTKAELAKFLPANNTPAPGRAAANRKRKAAD